MLYTSVPTQETGLTLNGQRRVLISSPPTVGCKQQSTCLHVRKEVGVINRGFEQSGIPRNGGVWSKDSLSRGLSKQGRESADASCKGRDSSSSRHILDNLPFRPFRHRRNRSVTYPYLPIPCYYRSRSSPDLPPCFEEDQEKVNIWDKGD